MKIVKDTEEIQHGPITLMIYGSPGVGKTSLAFTAENPLLLDFDNGAHRSEFRKDTAVLESWEDALSIVQNPATRQQIEPYKTIVVDTVGRCLDYLTQAVIREDRRLGTRAGGLTMQGWGALKSRFTYWVAQIKLLGKDVVFLAHEVERTEGDSRILRPDVPGGSLEELKKMLDLLGYYTVSNGQRFLTWNPTERTLGKNSAAFDDTAVQSFRVEPDFLASLILKAKEKIGGVSDEARAKAIAWLAFSNRLEKADDVSEFGQLVTDANELPEDIVVDAKKAILKRAALLGFSFDRDAQAFILKGKRNV